MCGGPKAQLQSSSSRQQQHTTEDTKFLMDETHAPTERGAQEIEEAVQRPATPTMVPDDETGRSLEASSRKASYWITTTQLSHEHG